MVTNLNWEQIFETFVNSEKIGWVFLYKFGFIQYIPKPYERSQLIALSRMKVQSGNNFNDGTVVHYFGDFQYHYPKKILTKYYGKEMLT